MSYFRVPEHKSSETLFLHDVEELLGINSGTIYMLSNGRLVSRSEPLQHGLVYHIMPRVLGGKGGFGSMLRAIGAQIEKTTSREACRDLSGRRIRDVNNEKKLKEWVSKQADREREKLEREERRRAKRAKYLEHTPSKMDNPEYNAQYAMIMQNSESALQQGLSKMKENGSPSRKRKAESSSALDKYDRWNMLGGVDVDGLDSDSGSESSDSNEAKPSTSSAQPSDPVSSSSLSSSSSAPDEASASSTGVQNGSTAFATVTSSALDGAASVTKGTHLGYTASATVTSSTLDGTAATAGTPCGSTASATVTSSSETSNSFDDAPPCKMAKLSTQENDTSQNTASSGTVSSTVDPSEPIDLDDFISAEELQALGMDRLKADLMGRGLKCGGNLQERGQRLFSIKGLSAEDIPAKLLAKGKGQGKSSQK